MEKQFQGAFRFETCLAHQSFYLARSEFVRRINEVLRTRRGCWRTDCQLASCKRLHLVIIVLVHNLELIPFHLKVPIELFDMFG